MSNNSMGENCHVITQGNHSFAWFQRPLPLVSYDEGSERTLLVAMHMFENTHPDLEITGWQIQMANNTTNSDRQSYRGVWFHHKPKTQETPRSRPDVSSPHDVGSDAG